MANKRVAEGEDMQKFVFYIPKPLYDKLKIISGIHQRSVASIMRQSAEYFIELEYSNVDSSGVPLRVEVNEMKKDMSKMLSVVTKLAEQQKVS